MDEEMILPDDFEVMEQELQTEEQPYSEDTNIVEEEETEALPQATEEAPQQEREDFLKVKYNHEERNLTPDEARELAQLGMFHKEKFQPQLDQYKYFDDLARKNNMSLNDLVSYYKNQEEQSALSEIMDYNDVTEDVAQELLEARRLREQVETEKQQRQAEEGQRNEIREFIEQFPGVELKDIPHDVFVKNQMGMPLKYAYLEHKYSQMKLNEKNESNRKSAPVQGVSTHGFKDNTVSDPFLEGFDF